MSFLKPTTTPYPQNMEFFLFMIQAATKIRIYSTLQNIAPIWYSQHYQRFMQY